MCIIDDCENYAIFNDEGGKPLYCIRHKSKDMIDVRLMCQMCKKPGSYKFPNALTNQFYCKFHAIRGMKNHFDATCGSDMTIHIKEIKKRCNLDTSELTAFAGMERKKQCINKTSDFDNFNIDISLFDR